MEFRGTKGKWTYEYDGDGMRFNEISCFIDDTYENYKEDSLLISKAPEILDMLINSVEVIKWYMENSKTELHEPFFNIGTNQIEQSELLIKEATEL